MAEAPRRIGTLASDENDADLVPPQPHERATTLDGLLGDLENALTADVSFEPITLQVDKRPGVAIRYRTQIDDDMMTSWRKRAEDRKRPNDLNTLRFCEQIVAAMCDAILMKGTEVHDEAGQNLTFGHKRIRTLYGADRAGEAARKVIGADPHVMIHANRILEAAGFGDQVVEVEGEDPTGLA